MTDLEILKKMTYPSERTPEDVHKYYKRALAELEKRFENKKDHPNYKELRALLIDQVNDELYDYGHDISNRRATET